MGRIESSYSQISDVKQKGLENVTHARMEQNQSKCDQHHSNSDAKTFSSFRKKNFHKDE